MIVTHLKENQLLSLSLNGRCNVSVEQTMELSLNLCCIVCWSPVWCVLFAVSLRHGCFFASPFVCVQRIVGILLKLLL